MKSVANKTRRPMKIPLRGGRYLHLGAAKTGQISDRDADLPAVKRMIEAGDIEVTGEAAHQTTGAGRAGAAPESTHGHPATRLVRPKGDR